MLRQVYLYYNNEQIFEYFFADAYDKETLDLVINKLSSYITDPLEAKVFSKPFFEYQSHFGMFKGLFFLFVTDMADRPQSIAKELDRAAKLFHKNFSNPLDIKLESEERKEFLNYIQETHYYLHPKLVLIGPSGSGKSSIVRHLRLSDKPEKKIMQFGEYYRIKLGDLYFDLWDFLITDDVSPLWNNFTRGSDMIYMVFDGTNLIDSKVSQFHTIRKREGKYSNAAVILTHQDSPDYISQSGFLEKYPDFEGIPIYEVELEDSRAPGQLNSLFIESLGLKKPLPPDFKQKLVKANDAVTQENYLAAIEILKDLAQISKDYHEYNYVVVFSKKIKELEEKQKEKEKQDAIEKAKIKAPTKIEFGSFKGVNTLPGTKSLPKVGSIGGGGLPLTAPKPTSFPTQSKGSKFDELIAQKLDSDSADITASSESAGESTRSPSEIAQKPEMDEETLSPLPDQKPEGEIEKNILSNIKSKNPFFKGLPTLTPKKAVPSLEPKITPPISTPIVENDENYIEKNLNISSNPSVDAEQAVSTSELESITPKPAGKKLSLERSPLVQKTPDHIVSDIAQKKAPTQSPSKNPLDGFNLLQFSTPTKQYAPEVEMLGEAIRDLGESLSRDLCEKFIEKLKFSMKKTNLTDADIKKAAQLYVLQRRRQQS